MSEKTWLKEFYPVEAEKCPKGAISATRHSLKKWRGALPANLKKHGLTEPPVFFSAWTCALCEQFYLSDSPEPVTCAHCPIFEARGERCFSRLKLEKTSPYDAYDDFGNPRPMIRVLEKTLKYLGAKETKK